MPMPYITLNQIRVCKPCKSGWAKLLSALGKTEADDEPIPLEFILESNGIQDAIWCMRVNWFKYKESVYMPFVKECAVRAGSYADNAAYAAAYAAATAATAAAATAATAATAAYAAATAATERLKQKQHLINLFKA